MVTIEQLGTPKGICLFGVERCRLQEIGPNFPAPRPGTLACGSAVGYSREPARLFAGEAERRRTRDSRRHVVSYLPFRYGTPHAPFGLGLRATQRLQQAT